MTWPMTTRIPDIQYSPLIEHIGKIDVTKETPQNLMSSLFKANPHTVRIDGRYV